jgi:hypothetical protein
MNFLHPFLKNRNQATTKNLGDELNPPVLSTQVIESDTKSPIPIDDKHRRLFLKLLVGAGVGVMTATLWPKKAEALVMGGAPVTSVVGVKNASNTTVNPATEDTLQMVLAGYSVLKKTVALTASGIVYTPTSGKKIRVYNTKFSMSANMTDISFRFTSGGTDYEKYLNPMAGGLYGANNQPNYVEGGVNQALYCNITGTGTVQINVDYLEV